MKRAITGFVTPIAIFTRPCLLICVVISHAAAQAQEIPGWIAAGAAQRPARVALVGLSPDVAALPGDRDALHVYGELIEPNQADTDVVAALILGFPGIRVAIVPAPPGAPVDALRGQIAEAASQSTAMLIPHCVFDRLGDHQQNVILDCWKKSCLPVSIQPSGERASPGVLSLRAIDAKNCTNLHEGVSLTAFDFSTRLYVDAGGQDLKSASALRSIGSRNAALISQLPTSLEKGMLQRAFEVFQRARIHHSPGQEETIGIVDFSITPDELEKYTAFGRSFRSTDALQSLDKPFRIEGIQADRQPPARFILAADGKLLIRDVLAVANLQRAAVVYVAPHRAAIIVLELRRPADASHVESLLQSMRIGKAEGETAMFLSTARDIALGPQIHAKGERGQ